MRSVGIWGPGLCYIAGALCLLAGLWGWQTEPRKELILLCDVSDSLLFTPQPDTTACVRALRPDRTVRFAFAGATRLLHDSAASASADPSASGLAVNPADMQTAQTNLAQAIEAAANLPAQGAIRRRVILFTDGRATTGDAVAAARTHASMMRLDIVPTGTVPQPDARAEWLSLPATAKTGQPLRAEGFVSSAAPATVRLELLSPAGAVLETRERVLTPGGNRETFDLPSAAPGLQAYTLRVHLANDLVPQNDSAHASVLVEGGNHLLWIGRRPLPQGLTLADGATLRHLPPEEFNAGALMAAGSAPAAASTSAPAALSAELASQPVAGVILDNLSARDLTGREELLADYLRRGGAALILGGDNSLAPGGWAGTPLAELLPAEVLPREQLQIVFALDVSGSMGEDNKLARAQGALRAAVDGLGPEDEAGLVLFAREARESLPLRPARDNDWDAALRNTAAGGGTSLFAGAQQALKMLQDAPALTGRRTAANRRHMLLLTDGDTLEKDAARTQAAAALRGRLQEAGVGLWVIALGKEAERAFLQELTSGIGGTTFAAGALAQLPQMLRADLDAARGGYRRGPFIVGGERNWTVRQTIAFGPLRGRPGDELLLQAQDGFTLAAQGREGHGRVLLLGGSPLADWQTQGQPGAPAFLSACLRELLRGPALAGGLNVRRTPTHIAVRWQPEQTAGRPYYALAQSFSDAKQSTPATPLRAQPGGVWTAELPAAFPGSGVISILEDPQNRLIARGALSLPPQAEYLQFGADGQALSALALAGGGRLAFQPGQLAQWDEVPASGRFGAPLVPATAALLFLTAGLLLRGWAKCTL